MADFGSYDMSNGSYGIVFLGQAKRLGSFPSHGGTIKVNHSLVP